MRLPAVVLALIAVFALAVVVEHPLNPQLDPAKHMISEYAKGRVAWLMQVGFVAWSLSFALTAEIVRRHQTVGLRRTFVALMSVACLGVAVLAAFDTQTSAGVLPSGVQRDLGGRLHDAGSGAATLAIFAAAVASAVSVRPLRKASSGLIAAAVVANVGLLALGPDVGGVRQRLLVAIGCAWQIVFVRRLITSERAGRRER